MAEDQFNLSLVLEHKIAQNKSIQIEAFPLFSKYKSTIKNGFGMACSYRKYFQKNNNDLKGIYISPPLKAGLVYTRYSSNFETKILNLNAAFLYRFENNRLLS